VSGASFELQKKTLNALKTLDRAQNRTPAFGWRGGWRNGLAHGRYLDYKRGRHAERGRQPEWSADGRTATGGHPR
jgi:hypothetical protein